MKVSVIFGGKSCEHNISIITGVEAINAASVNHEIIPIYIDQQGLLWYSKCFSSLSSFADGAKVKKQRVFLQSGSRYLYSIKGKPLEKIDAALLCTHGTFGEDGSLQGYLRLCGIPYTGCGVLASSISMNKVASKKVFLASGLPVLPFVSFTKKEYSEQLDSVIEKVTALLKFPIIVKPANLGSSIGITLARDFPSLFASIDAALRWDNHIILENALEDFSEFNAAVLGSGNDLIVSEVEQPLLAKDFLSFEDKYIKKQKKAKKIFPADIEPSLKERIQRLAKDAFKAVGASGVARVDFLYKDGELFVNEINTIPGALSNYLFSKGENKLSYPKLIDRLISQAIKRHLEEESLEYVYKSPYKLFEQAIKK